MCGRYAASRRPEDLVEDFEVDESHVGPGGEEPVEPVEPKWNVAPTDRVHVVLERRPRGDPDAAPTRQLRVARWGLVPSWAKDVSIGARLINARVETVADKPAFRKAFAARRCLVPADGYYEWYASTEARTSKGRPLKQPFFIAPRDGRVLAMAGLYELWRDRDRPDGDPEAWLWSCTILTTTAEDDLGRIHDRMPLFVEPDRYDAWLDPSGGSDPDALRGLLVPASPGLLQAVPVSTKVNKVTNDGPDLVEPLPLEDVPADVLDGARAADGTDQPGLF